MSIIDFPDITPSSMDFVAPRFPVGVDTSLGGFTTRRRFGNRQYDGRLTVEFRNIPNSVCAQILLMHKESKGLAAIFFKDSFFNGAGEEYKPYLDCSAYQGLAWYFVEESPPRANRIEGGAQLSNLSVEFVARLVAA